MPLDPLHSSFFVPLAILGAFIVLAIGFAVGRYFAARPFRQQIEAFMASETLGAMLSAEEWRVYALAYKDSDAAAREMAHFSYAVPNVLTPFVGSGPRPGQNENAFINAMQFRSDREVMLPKPAGTRRIFITGGSTAFGSGAPSQETIVSAYLQELLESELTPSTRTRYEVLTLANPSWTSTHERIVIENRLSELNPDMVIALSGSNDVHWAGAGRDIMWFRTYADQHFWELLNRARQLGGTTAMPEIIAGPASVSPVRVAELLEKNVRLSALALGLTGARYVFVLQPALALTTKPLSVREEALRASLPPTARQNFITCYEQMNLRLASIRYDHFTYLDQSDVFAGMSLEDEIFLDSYHFGDRGNEILARAIRHGIGPILS